MLNPSLDDKDIINFEDSLEPINVKPRFEDPKAKIDQDKSKNWFRRVLPILLANKCRMTNFVIKQSRISLLYFNYCSVATFFFLMNVNLEIY